MNRRKLGDGSMVVSKVKLVGHGFDSFIEMWSRTLKLSKSFVELSSMADVIVTLLAKNAGFPSIVILKSWCLGSSFILRPPPLL